MASLKDKIEQLYKDGDAMIKLIFINVAVFVFFWFLALLDFLFKINTSGAFEYYTVLPSNLSEFIFKPWTLFTYMFRHAGFVHILWNMLFFYIFARTFITYLGGKKLFSTFILSGISGGILYMLAYNIFPAFSDVVGVSNNRGASGAIMGVAVAIATYAPHAEISLPFNIRIRLLWIVLFSIVKDLVFFPEGNNAGGLLAHFGGAIFGYISIRQFQKGRDLTSGFDKFMDSIANWFKPKSKIKKVYSSGNKSRSNSTAVRTNKDQERVNEILDKISRSGYESLSKSEKDFLFKFGKD
tara:strand:+ start:29290 stop:30180 length:891 start_codon:yes stop_codon:yes gene_type:complete